MCSRNFHIRRVFALALVLSAITAPAGDASAQALKFENGVTTAPCLRWVPEFPKASPDTVRIRIIGDMMMHTLQLEAARKEYVREHPEIKNHSAADPEQYSFTRSLSMLEEDLAGADLAVANMEFPLGGAPYTGYPAFSTPETYPEYICEKGVDVFLTANNHILDRGYKGLVRTLAHYNGMEAQGRIKHTGCSLDAADDSLRNPLVVRLKGIRVAIINFTYGANFKIADGYPKVNRMSDLDGIGRSLKKARENGADLVLVIPHWGTEYKLRHSAAQEKMARWLAENGADIIVGAHPHVIQDYDVIRVNDGTVTRSVPVYYSLGNAHSNMSAENTQLELMVTITLTRNSNGNVTMMAPHHDFLWCSRPGFLSDAYTTFKVDDLVGRREVWKNPSDYDRMVRTLDNVKKATGLE